MKDEFFFALGVFMPDPPVPEPPASPGSPNPQPLSAALSIDNVDGYKRSDCLRYVRCMNTAARQNWHQFHCNACGAYEAAPPTEDEQKLAKRLLRVMRS